MDKTEETKVAEVIDIAEPTSEPTGLVVNNYAPPAMVNTFANRTTFQEIFDMGKMLAVSNLVPEAYKGKPQDCAIAIDMANRIGIGPMMVMQNLYIVKGKPSWSGQACTALIKASREFKNVTHVYIGEKGTDSRGCYVRATRVSDGEIIEGPTVDMNLVKAEGWISNKKWQTMPELMLAYRAAAFFARIHIPNTLMGCHVEGEIEDMDVKSSKKEALDPFMAKKVQEKQ